MNQIVKILSKVNRCGAWGIIIAKDHKSDDGSIKRLSIDCKATINIGEYSRGGQTRGNNQASDHDLGCKDCRVAQAVRKRSISLMGGAPNIREYSRLNCEGLSYPTW